MPLHLVALDEVHHARELIRRQATQQRQAHVAMPLRLREAEADHEHLLVVAHLAVVGVPRGQPHIEARILRQDFLVQGIEGSQVAVRCRQQRVEQIHPQVTLGHWLSLPSWELSRRQQSAA